MTEIRRFLPRRNRTPEAPKKANGDNTFVIVGSIVGMVTGGLIGGNYNHSPQEGALLGTVAGGFAGAIAGNIARRAAEQIGFALVRSWVNRD